MSDVKESRSRKFFSEVVAKDFIEINIMFKNVSHMGKVRNGFRILVGKLEGRTILRKIRRR
jgi:hypothetical protein